MSRVLLDELLGELLNIGKFGLGEAAEKLSEAAGSEDDPLKSFLLSRAAQLLEEEGENTLDLVRQQFEDLLDGKNLDPTKVRELPLHERGPLLSASLRKEINLRKKGESFLVVLGSVLGVIVKEAAKSALG